MEFSYEATDKKPFTGIGGYPKDMFLKIKAFPTDAQKIEYLKLMLESQPVEAGIKYYRSVCDVPIPHVWRAIIYSALGQPIQIISNDDWEERSIDIGKETWGKYVRLKQMLRDIENGKQIDYDEEESPSDRIFEGLSCLSKKWKGKQLLDGRDLQKLVSDIQFIEANHELPNNIKRIKKSTSGISDRFYTYTIYNLWKSLHRAKDGSQSLWLEYICLAFYNFNPEMTTENLSKVFSKPPASYTQDLDNLI